MIYVATLQDATQILVTALSPRDAERKLGEKAATRVERIDALEAVLHRELGGMALIKPWPSSLHLEIPS